MKVAYWATARVVVGCPRPSSCPSRRSTRRWCRSPGDRDPAVAADPDRLFELVRAAFGQRRKMLRRSLADRVTPAMFEQADIRPEARPEELGIEQWGRLADAMLT